MRGYLLTASQRTLSVAYGLFFGTVMVVVNFVRRDGSPAIGVIVGAVLTGVAFGALMGWQVSYQHEQARAAAGGALTDAEFREAALTSAHSPAPTDHRVREAAERLIRFRLAEYARRRGSDLPILALAAAGFILAAIFVSAWWGLGALAFAYALSVYFSALPRLTRRLRILQTGSTGAPEGE